MPAVTRTLKITYGATFYVGGDSAYLIHGPVRFEKSYTAFVASFQVVVQNDTASTFKTNCDTVEAAFRTPRQKLKIEMESQTFIELDPSVNTGFLAEPSISNGADTVAETGRSRLYDVSVAVALPADLSGQSGRADSSIVLDYDASRRRTITITGRYTALGPNSARAQYNSAIGTYSSSILSSLASGATFDLMVEDVNPDDADKNCSFTRVYREVLYASTSGGLSHASIVGSAISYARRRPAPGDSIERAAKRLEEVTVSFSCNVNQSVSTSLESLYNDSVRPWLLSQATSLFGASATAVVDETRSFDKTANTIAATLDLRMVIGGGITLEYTRTVGLENQYGVTLQPVWDKSSDLAKHKFRGIARRVRTITVVETVLGVYAPSGDGKSFVGGQAGGGVANIGGGAGAGAKFNSGKPAAAAPAPGGGGGGSTGAEPIGGGGWEQMSSRRFATTRKMGIDGNTITVTDLQTVIEEEYHDEPSGGGGGGTSTTPSEPNMPGFTSPGGAVTGGMR